MMQNRGRCALAALMAVLIASGAAAQAKPVKLTFVSWLSNKDQLALLETFVKEFNERKGSALEVTFQNIPFAEYNTKLVLQLQTSTPPDLGLILESTAPAFIDAKLLAPLDAALKPYNPADFVPKTMELWTRGRTTYAVPLSTSPFFLFYNEDLFRKAGVPTPPEQIAAGTWTWDGFRAASAAIQKAAGVYGYQGIDGQGYESRIFHNITPLVRSFGGEIWANGKVGIDGAESAAALKLFLAMLNEDKSIVPPGNQSDFFNGAAAMTAGQISRISKLSAVSWKWGIAPMPAGPKGAAPVIGQAGLGAFAKGKNAKVAAELVAYLSSPSCEERLAKFFPPARESVLSSPAFLKSVNGVSEDQMKTVVVDAIRTGRTLGAHASYPQIEAETRPAFDKLWKADANADAVLAEIGRILRKYVK